LHSVHGRRSVLKSGNLTWGGGKSTEFLEKFVFELKPCSPAGNQETPEKKGQRRFPQGRTLHHIQAEEAREREKKNGLIEKHQKSALRADSIICDALETEGKLR